MANNPRVIKEYTPAEVVDADWDGTVSDWFTLEDGKPVRGLLLEDIVAGDITIHVSDTITGVVAYLLDVSSSLTSVSGDVAFFLPELAPFQYARLTSTGTQVNGKIKLARSA